MTAALLKHPVHALCLICDVNGIASEEGELTALPIAHHDKF